MGQCEVPFTSTCSTTATNCDRTIKFFSRVPFFAIFLNECSPHTGGDRGKAECGASAEGWRERPALALFHFWTDFAALMLL